jgi:hypothetical protein
MLICEEPVPPGMDVGLKEALAPVGKPAAVKLTGAVKPPEELSETV